MVSKILAGWWAKRESFSAHLAWGIAIELALAVRGLSAETAFCAVILVAAAWELGGELITVKIQHYWAELSEDLETPRPYVWTSRALDIPPWAIGAALGWLTLSL